MADATAVNVRHRVSWWAKAFIHLTHVVQICSLKFPSLGCPLGFLAKFPPRGLLCWVVNNSSYVSVNHGPWQKLKLDVTPAEFDQ